VRVLRGGLRTCRDVRIGLRASSPRGNGVAGTFSTPTMRTISSTMSALPSMSGRHDGIRDLHGLALAGDEEPELVEHALHFGERHVEAGETLHLGDREIR